MTRSHAKALRANMTEAGRRLWYFLRAHRFAGMKFKRQALIGRYIVDFVSFQRRLVDEVDGGQHADSEADLRRTRWLEDQGFRIVRFWNNEGAEQHRWCSRRNHGRRYKPLSRHAASRRATLSHKGRGEERQ